MPADTRPLEMTRPGHGYR